MLYLCMYAFIIIVGMQFKLGKAHSMRVGAICHFSVVVVNIITIVAVSMIIIFVGFYCRCYYYYCCCYLFCSLNASRKFLPQHHQYKLPLPTRLAIAAHTWPTENYGNIS